MEVSFLSEYSYDTMWYNSPSTKELPEQLEFFTAIALSPAEMPMSDERLVCKIHSATPVFCFPWKGEVHQSALEIILKIHSRGKEEFAHLRMVLSFIAVSFGCSVLWGTPRLVLLSGQVLSTGGAWAKTAKKLGPKPLVFLLWWRNWEREALLSTM